MNIYDYVKLVGEDIEQIKTNEQKEKDSIFIKTMNDKKDIDNEDIENSRNCSNRGVKKLFDEYDEITVFL